MAALASSWHLFWVFQTAEAGQGVPWAVSATSSECKPRGLRAIAVSTNTHWCCCIQSLKCSPVKPQSVQPCGYCRHLPSCFSSRWLGRFSSDSCSVTEPGGGCEVPEWHCGLSLCLFPADNAELPAQIRAPGAHSPCRRPPPDGDELLLPWDPVHSSDCLPERGGRQVPRCALLTTQELS